jgi:hypothetical protein
MMVERTVNMLMLVWMSVHKALNSLIAIGNLAAILDGIARLNKTSHEG